MLKSESGAAADVRALAAEADLYDRSLTEVVDRRMNELGLTYRDLAARTGIGETTMWNRLRTGGFRPREQYRIADALAISISDLCTAAVERMHEVRR